MRLEITYKKILSIAGPIMLGSAVQNVIALSDSAFLFMLSQDDFAAMGIVGVFYLAIAAVGYGFSKGGQIMIARRMGEEDRSSAGKTFYAMLYFELSLATILFLFMKYGAAYFFPLFINSPVYIEKCLAYLDYRAYGVFFSYAGLSIVALYTGVARTRFIVIDTLILAVVNMVLNYMLIFGVWGLPAMGISGAGLASTIAEGVALVLFLLYMLWDKGAWSYKIFKLHRFDLKLIKRQQQIASPMVAQAVVGMGSWFLFFSMVEKLGARELAISNLVRMAYLILSVPSWGFSSGVNTMVSNIIGQAKQSRVMLAIWKTAKMSLLSTVALSVPLVLFIQQILGGILSPDKLQLVQDAQPVLYVLVLILSVFSVASIYFNGLAGTGATFFGLKMQIISVLCYLSLVYVVVFYIQASLAAAWASEIFYWTLILIFSVLFLRSKKWHAMKV